MSARLILHPVSPTFNDAVYETFYDSESFPPSESVGRGEAGVTECHTLRLLHNPHKGGYITSSVVRPWLSSNLFLRTWDYSFT